MEYEKLIRELVDRKAEQDNQIDLNAYENGMRAITEALSLHNVVGQSEQFYCSSWEDGERKCETQCLRCARLEEQVKQ